MEVKAEAWIAIYAAIVATGALTLEIRRWFENGPKLCIRARGNMVLLDGAKEIKGLLVVDVSNRGSATTTLTNLAILEFSSRWSRLRMRPAKSFIIPHPQLPGNKPVIPHVLPPGEQWMGMAYDRSDVTGDIQTGTFWAAVYTTDRERPYLARIPKKAVREELKEACNI